MKRNKKGLIVANGYTTTAQWFNLCQEVGREFSNINRKPDSQNEPSVTITNSSDSAAEICIFGPITPYAWLDYGEMDAISFYQQLQALKGQDITVRIKSDGGSVFEGVAIYNFLKDHDGHVTVRVEGNAASIASVIAMAGDDIQMGEASNMMIHDASVFGGRMNATEMRKYADILDKLTCQIAGVYKRRTNMSLEDIRSAMAEETIYTGAECIEHGFADSLFEDVEDLEDEPPAPEPKPTPEPIRNAMDDEAWEASQRSFKEAQNILDSKCHLIS